ncbi:MAG TPA: sodium:solute symporter [Phycisphaerales bacterium]|nr:sodium:solute symporter [Phycisphaerales bacterium]
MQDADPGATFGPLDWTVLAAYAAALVAVGFVFTRRQKTTSDYFLAGRQMPVWAVAASILATALSAATFIGAPQNSYLGDLTYLSTNIGGLLSIFIVAYAVVPACYRRGATTVYELLDDRFGPVTKRAAGLMFLFGRTLASGARVYIGALPAAVILFGDDFTTAQLGGSIAIFTVISIVYTLAGGMRTVIWVDVMQSLVFVVAAAAAIAVLLAKIPLGPAEIVSALGAPTGGEESKLQLIDLSTRPDRPYTLWTALIAFTLMGIASYGTDQDMVQRMLTCRNAIAGGRSAILGIVIGVPVVALFLAVGLLLWVFYSRPDLMGAAAPDYPIDDSRQVFLSFIIHEMPPGLSGLMIAGLFAAALGSVNSLAATSIEDFYKPALPGRSERHYLRAGRLAVVGWGILLGVVAGLCILWHDSEKQTLIDFALGVMTFAWSGLAAVFLSALFTRRGSTASSLGAFVVGFLIVLACQPGVWAWWTDLLPFTRATPAIEGDFRLAEVKLAWPWHLVLGVAGAFAVCQLGTPANRARSASEAYRARSASEGPATSGPTQ